MPGSRFLNPTFRIFLCLTGAAVMGATLYPVIGTDFFADPTNILRLLFFFGFAFLLFKEIVRRLKRDSMPTAQDGDETRRYGE